MRGIAAAVVAGAVAGIAWWFFNFITYGWIFALIVGAGIGYLLAQAVSFATNGRRGPPLQAIAASGVVVAYLVRLGMLIIVDGWTLNELRGFEIFAFAAVLIGGYIAAQRVG